VTSAPPRLFGLASSSRDKDGVRLVRAVLDHNGLHALASDSRATIGGKVAVSVTAGEESE
jgi:hypothetical protein